MNLQQVRDEIKALQTRAVQMAQELFNEGSKEVFADFPELVSFSWSQFTPYFNDGDTCTFGAYNDYLEIVLLIDGEEVEIEEFDGSEWSMKYLAPEVLPYYDKLVKLHDWIKQFGDEELLAMFGDHANVTVTIDGASVHEYSQHD